MTLATHGIIGAAVASAFPDQPVVGLAAAFASHFLLDALPHWDYSIQALRKDAIGPLSLVDLLKIGVDFALGIILSLMLLPLVAPSALTMLGCWLIVGGALAGMLPDLFQFIYLKFHWRWLCPVQRLHNWAHTKTEIEHRPALGVMLQLAIILVALLVVYNIR